MGLFSIFQRGNGAAPAPAEAGDPVQAARVRARQRLIGAVVLVVIGVIGFPLVFETQPRPIPLDIPIEIPRRDAAAPLVLPAPRPAPAGKGASGAVAPREEITTETRAEAGKPIPAPAPAASAAAVPTAEAAKKPAVVARPAASAPVAADAARAKALLEGKDNPAATAAAAAKAEDPKETSTEAGRYVLQVGAFADASAARETRSKVEKLGLKTYTQVVETAAGSRTRVRVGPFASRDEADKALAKARDAGINAVVLTL